jgi:hypothetical protein
MTGGIAVGGFLGHMRPGLSGGSDGELRRATTIGGLVGLGSLILAFIGLAVLAGATAVAISITDAGGAVLGLAIGLFAALGGYVSSVIVMHYSALEKRKEREETLLR